jgi:tripartite-type tricarboxylate transporter receptor subunit TctC
MTSDPGQGRRGLLAMAGLAAAAVGLAPGGAVRAQQAYPSRTIRILVPFGAGGAVDIVARLVAEQLTPRLGQTVIVENRTGGGGNIAMEAAARAQPDGYTLLMASPSVTINPSLYPNLSYDPATQLAPVAQIAEVPSVLLAAPNLEAGNAKDFIELARRSPGRFTFASGGAGTSEHLAGELLKAREKLDIVHVPYRGGAPALNDLLAGRVAVMFTNLLNALPHLRAGGLRALGVTDRSRAPAIPEVPSFAELGIPDFDITVWWGLMGPAGMPAEAVQRINREVEAALATPEMRARLDTLSARPLGGAVERFAQRLAEERGIWSEVIRNAGIKLD